jgi:hypothetical protein
MNDAPSTKADAKRASGSEVTLQQFKCMSRAMHLPMCEVVAEYEPPAPPICLIGALESCLGVYDYG